MLVPAVCYKDQIEHYSDVLRYSDEAIFYNGCTETGRIQITTEPTEGRYQWAIVDKNMDLVGYISYMVDYYSSNAYGFGLITFVDNKPAMMVGIREAIRNIRKMNLNRLEFRCVGGNPAYKKYVDICALVEAQDIYRYRVIRLVDVFKDAYGNYHDQFIFELLREVNK